VYSCLALNSQAPDLQVDQHPAPRLRHFNSYQPQANPGPRGEPRRAPRKRLQVVVAVARRPRRGTMPRQALKSSSGAAGLTRSVGADASRRTSTPPPPHGRRACMRGGSQTRRGPPPPPGGPRPSLVSPRELAPRRPAQTSRINAAPCRPQDLTRGDRPHGAPPNKITRTRQPRFSHTDCVHRPDSSRARPPYPLITRASAEQQNG